MAVDCPLAEAADLSAAVLSEPHEPAALEWVTDTGTDGTLLIRLEGTPDALPTRAERLRTATPGSTEAGGRTTGAGTRGSGMRG